METLCTHAYEIFYIWHIMSELKDSRWQYAILNEHLHYYFNPGWDLSTDSVTSLHFMLFWDLIGNEKSRSVCAVQKCSKYTQKYYTVIFSI